MAHATGFRTWATVGVGTTVLTVALAVPSVASAQGAASTPVFTKDVAPIFQEKCEACHRPESMAPMSLVTYEEARPWAQSIKARVVSRQMPPWHLDKSVGIQHFQNDRSLSDAEIDTIVHWVDGGTPKATQKTCRRPSSLPMTTCGASPSASAGHRI